LEGLMNVNGMTIEHPGPLGHGQQPDRRGSGMYDQLLRLLEYRVVLGALVTTLDGLVVASAGLGPDDAEMLAAAGSMQSNDQMRSSSVTRGGVLHVLRGADMRLLVLTEPAAPAVEVDVLMRHALALLERSIEV
jgi:hypothetical protein